MAVVNKFNVNKQQVTLDPDIIENMSANDVSYNSSLQYDENTVGNKLSELAHKVDEMFGSDEKTISLSDVPSIQMYLSLAVPHKWSSYQHFSCSIINVESGKMITFSPNPNYAFRYCFLKNNEHEIGTDAEISSENPTLYYITPTDGEQNVIVPSDSGYIYIQRTDASNNNVSPSTIKIEETPRSVALLDEVVLLEPQELSETEKRNVRNNIGALSEEEINDVKKDVITNKLGIEGIEKNVFGSEYKTINISDIKENYGYIDNNGYWKLYRDYSHSIIYIGRNNSFCIESNTQQMATLRFLKSNVFAKDELVDLSNEVNVAVNVGAGEKNVLVMPSDADYLYILRTTSTQNTPTSLTFDKIDGFANIIGNEVMSFKDLEFNWGLYDTISYGSHTYTRYNFVDRTWMTSKFLFAESAMGISYDRSLFDVKITYFNNEQNLIYTEVPAADFCEIDKGKFFRISAKLKDGMITEDEANTISIVSLKDVVRELQSRDFVRDNRNVIPIVETCIGNNKLVNTSQSFIIVSDLHGEFLSLDDAYSVKNIIHRVNKNIVLTDIPILSCGDMFFGTPKVNGVLDPKIDVYIDKAKRYNVYHTCGQHEVGFIIGNDPTGKLKSNCLTHQEVFEYFIEPMKSTWGLPSLDTIWYYKDFNNIRLISLYQYNTPEDDGVSPSYRKYKRNAVWYGQNQIDWLINTLKSTPEGFGIVIMMHQTEVQIVSSNDNSSFFTESAVSEIMIDGSPIKDIVSAFVDRTTINKTYIGKYDQSDGTDYSELSCIANADFTSCKGIFFNFFFGDSHIDCVGFLQNTTLRAIGVTSSSDSFDCSIESNNTIENIYVNTSDAQNSSIVSIAGYVPDKRFIKYGRLGSQFSEYGQVRMIERITY